MQPDVESSCDCDAPLSRCACGHCLAGARSQRYDGYDLPAALELFCAARAWNLRLVSGAAPEDFARDAMHPERGSVPFQVQLETMAGHDLNHLEQVEAVVT